MEGDKIALPLVSVIIAIYNGEKFIADAVNSVLKQTYNNIEIIVVNDASTDNTAEVLNNLSSKQEFTVLTNKTNIGAATTRNVGYANANGELIKFLDGDDLINTEAISEQVKLAARYPNCIISGKYGRFYNNDITTFKLYPEECWQTMPSTDWLCSSWMNARSMTNPGIFLIPQSIIDKAGLWDESLSLIDDFEYFARTVMAADKVVFCDGATLYYRSGIINSLSGIRTHKGYQSAYLSIEKGTAYLLQRRNDDVAKLACANTWQSFIYDAYPSQTDLVQKAQSHLDKLPQPDIKFPGGRISKTLSALLGWKAVKKLKLLRQKK